MSFQFFETFLIDLKKLINNDSDYHTLEQRINDYVNSSMFYENAPKISGHFITLNGHHVKLYLALDEKFQTTFEIHKEH